MFDLAFLDLLNKDENEELLALQKPLLLHQHQLNLNDLLDLLLLLLQKKLVFVLGLFQYAWVVF